MSVGQPHEDDKRAMNFEESRETVRACSGVISAMARALMTAC
jgi:hypothetical protein